VYEELCYSAGKAWDLTVMSQSTVAGMITQYQSCRIVGAVATW